MHRVGSMLLLAALAVDVRGQLQIDIPVADLVGNVSCFDPQTCGPTYALARIRNLSTQWQWTRYLDIAGPGGTPLAYHFVLVDDGQLPPGPNNLDALEIEWNGPGFHYTYQWVCQSLSCLLDPPPWEPPPGPFVIEPANGCSPPQPVLDWNREQFPGGEVLLASSFVVRAGDTLHVEDGMSIRAAAGAGIRIEGVMLASGSAESVIEFDGPGWRGIAFAAGGRGRLEHTRIRGAASSVSGGALQLAMGSTVDLDHCIIDHNTTLGRGGGVFVSDGAQLTLRSCTVSHNSASSGGNLYVEAGGFVSGYYNLVTFGTPETMVSEEWPLASNLNYSDVYPLAIPGQGTGWYCDPGYVDADRGDFRLSFRNPDHPTEVNCTIDAAPIAEDVDPDGTPTDMGALPIDQHDVLWPPTIRSVQDSPGDEGGWVTLDFGASRNDGPGLNPVSFYSVWVHYPGTEDFISSGQTVGALGQEHYTVRIATSADSSWENGNQPATFRHDFKVVAHSESNPDVVAHSLTVSGYSCHDLAPAAVSGGETAPEWICSGPEDTAWLDIWWNPVSASDLAYYSILASTSGQIADAVPVSGSQSTHCRHSIPVEDYQDERFTYFIHAVDESGNRSSPLVLEGPVVDCSMGLGVPGSMTLLSAHPNPFNPSTRITFGLAAECHVRLFLYDMTGRRVMSLVDGYLTGGLHEIMLDGSRLATGTYFLRLEAGTRTDTRKLLLLK